MKRLFKILLFLILLCAVSITQWKLARQSNENFQFGDEYIGKSQQQIFNKLGEPKIIRETTLDKADWYFQQAFSSLQDECNTQNKVTYLMYDQFWSQYEFWLFENKNVNTVILVR